MSRLRTLHELHEKHDNLWWIVVGVVSTIAVLVFAGTVMGWWW